MTNCKSPSRGRPTIAFHSAKTTAIDFTYWQAFQAKHRASLFLFGGLASGDNAPLASFGVTSIEILPRDCAHDGAQFEIWLDLRVGHFDQTAVLPLGQTRTLASVATLLPTTSASGKAC